MLFATHVAHPAVEAALSLVVDASSMYLDACLQQQLPGMKEWQLLGFFSKNLEATQQKYSAFDRELFACYSEIMNFLYILDGRCSAVFTDQADLCPVLGLWMALSAGRCLTWQSLHQKFATSLGQPTWSQMPSPGCQGTGGGRGAGGLPRRRLV
jgi:hypothetical protein